MKKSTPSVLQTKAVIIGGFKATATVGDKLEALPNLEPGQRQNQIKGIAFPPKQSSGSMYVVYPNRDREQSIQDNKKKTGTFRFKNCI